MTTIARIALPAAAGAIAAAIGLGLGGAYEHHPAPQPATVQHQPAPVAPQLSWPFGPPDNACSPTNPQRDIAPCDQP